MTPRKSMILIYLIFSFFLISTISVGSDNYIPYGNAYWMDVYVRGPSSVVSYADVYLDQCNYLGRADDYGYLRAIVPPGHHSLFATKYVYELNRWYCGSGKINFPVSIITMTAAYSQNAPGITGNPCNIC